MYGEMWLFRYCCFYIPYMTGLMKTVLKKISPKCYRFSLDMKI